ncbi:hypothetical protein CMUST_03755 [Corynebacterium mustelae]|uniref:Peptidase propeptide domain-containing protein n=1 Tax=Corynebacterium mustelae TaxID=571915 RepID=A0A0G3GX16_9CORY|nr:hypothetical protein [Corynebacterium mustelae]AKK05095.1 hypothetical protein CMUST_03755 [Corynebacterium mustelae]
MFHFSRPRLLVMATALVIAAPVIAACTDGGSDNVAANTTPNIATATPPQQRDIGKNTPGENIGNQTDLVVVALAEFAADEAATGIVTSADQVDGDMVEITVYEGTEKAEYDAAPNGEITERGREGKTDTDDEVVAARAATVSAMDALSQAVAQEPNLSVDSISLVDDPEVDLHWTVEFTDPTGGAGTTVDIPALDPR